MKIVCDACQAKYSISDDKVQGKVFKIRCKKCSNIIVVRGGAGAAEPAPAPQQEKETRVYDYGYDGGDQQPAGDEAVWHVVINQDQVGPMTAAEVQQRFAAGEIDGETYAWREGFADWLPLAQVDTFAAYVAAGSAAAPAASRSAPGGGGAEAIGAMFGGGMADDGGATRNDPGDLFAAASAGARHADDDGGDLFGSKPVAAAPAPAPAAAKLRGERNENSVLFSLNNLAQLASDKPAPAPAAVSTMPGHASGAAGGEGSGLIDIRSMANAYMGGTGTAAKPATSSAIGSIDDLPVFGGGGFSEPAVIVPTVRPQSNNKLMYALIGSVGLLAVAAVILVVVMVTGSSSDDKPPTVAAGERDPGEPAKEPDSKTPDSAARTPDSAAKTPDSAAKTPDVRPPDSTPPDTTAKPPDTTAKAPDTTTRTPDTRPKQPVRPKQPTVARNDPPKTPKDPPPTPTTKEPAGACDEISCLVNPDGACCPKRGKANPKPGGGTPTAGGRTDLPASLDRAMITEGVAKVKARVQSCGDRSSAKGTVKVGVKVTPDGAVSSVTVKESPDAGLGSCVASAMQRASFRKTQSGGSFSFPFVF